jgi:two-component system, OmpR family, sensor kinase
MHSLRTRLLTGVLLLSAAGLVLLGAVTYAEQRSFLEGRVNQEVRSAWPAISQVLDREGFRPPAPSSGHSPTSGAQVGPHGPLRIGGSIVNLPPGTYGQRRSASGAILGHTAIKYSSSEAAQAAPELPAQVPIGTLFTVDSVGSEDMHYRVIAFRDPEDSGITVVAVPLSDVDQTLNRLLLVEGLVIAGVLVALGLTAFFVVRLGLRPLSRMEVTAGVIAAGELSRRVSPADGRTEVGRLGRALNAMLDRLEAAFAERQASEDRLREFLADASHELRTPLASIRGYAELFRMGATQTRQDTETAMRRIEDESRRMGVLVEDLLTLARLDEAPELRRQPVDLAKLARDAAKDALATAPDRSISVTGPAVAVVSGDPHQLHQVVANLMRNALVHTPAGSAIEVSVEGGPESVAVSVRDHGPGLSEDARARLFDRFWRSEGGRERGKAGAGLGLAIVRDIVAAHGGEVAAGNAPDGGAVFVVRLPLTARPATGAPAPAASRGAPQQP